MTDTFKDGIEAAARYIDENCRAGIETNAGDLARAIRALELPRSTALTISPLAEAFEQFKCAYISIGGARNPKMPSSKGWRPAEKVFTRLIMKDKHDAQAIITGTQAYADYMRKVIARDPSKVTYVPAPAPFLNGEQFMQAWDRANPTTPSGSQRGAPSMFDVAEMLTPR